MKSTVAVAVALATSLTISRPVNSQDCGAPFQGFGTEQEYLNWCMFACLEFVCSQISLGSYKQCDFAEESARLGYDKPGGGWSCCGNTEACSENYLTFGETDDAMNQMGFLQANGADVRWYLPATSEQQIITALCGNDYLFSAQNRAGFPDGHAVVLCNYDDTLDRFITNNPNQALPWQAVTFEDLSTGEFQGSFGPMIGLLKVRLFLPTFVGIDDVSALWVEEVVPSNWVELGYEVHWTAAPGDSSCLYVSDNPWGPARRYAADKPLDESLPYGESVVRDFDHYPYEEHATYYYFLDHGPGGFPALRLPAGLRDCVDNPVEFPAGEAERDTLDAPILVSLVPAGPNPQVGLRVTWELSDDDAIIDYYNVYRQEDREFDPGWIWLASVPPGTSSFVDSVTVFTDVDYTYRVSAAHHGLNTYAGQKYEGSYNEFSEVLTGVAKSGALAVSETWSGIVFVTGDIIVPSGKSLTLTSGTRVSVWPVDTSQAGADHGRVEINVEGTLVVNGTSNDPVVFESWDPETTEDWVGFYFDDQSGGGTFNHCVISRAEYAIESYVPLSVKNTTIEDCRYAGVVVQAGNSLVQGCTLTRPGTYGVFLTAASTTIRNTTIDDATSVACNVQPNATLTARNSQFLNSDTGLYIGGFTTVSVDTTCVFNSNDIGIHCYGTSYAASVKRSTINSNTSNGIFCDNGSDPTIEANTLRYNLIAINCDASSPTIQGNMIKTNSKGVVTAEGSDPDIGHYSTSGNNTFAYTSSKHIVNFDTNITLYAQNNCWNDNSAPCGPPGNMIYGYVDTSSPICCSVGSSEVFTVPGAGDEPPPVTGLSAIIPNPFNPITTFHYGIAAPGGTVKLTVYDVGGRLVRTLVDGRRTAGKHQVVWDGTDRRGSPVASGIYFAKMTAEGAVFTRKMVLLK